MFMNLNTGICNIKKKFKTIQSGEKHSAVSYRGLNIQMYLLKVTISFLTSFFLRIKKHNPTHPKAYKAADRLHTRSLIFAVCTVITVPKEKWGEGRQQRLFKVSYPTSMLKTFWFSVFPSFYSGKNHYTLIVCNELNANVLNFRGMAMASTFPK